MIRITHPRPEKGTQKDLGVVFMNGTALVEDLHPVREQALLQHGYGVEKDFEVDADTAYEGGREVPFVDLTTLTVPQLQELAAANGLDVPARARKGELIDAISRLPAEPAIDPSGIEEG